MVLLAAAVLVFGAGGLPCAADEEHDDEQEYKEYEDDEDHGGGRRGSGKRPPGWDRGEKKGWTSDIPPGLAKKGKLPPGLAKKRKLPPGWSNWKRQKRARWEKDLKHATSAVRRRAGRERGLEEDMLESALLSLDRAARAGVPVNDARDIILNAVEEGLDGEDIERASRAAAYGVGKGMDFDELGSYVNEMLDGGLRGNELAIEIYREVVRRQEFKHGPGKAGKAKKWQDEQEEEGD